MQFWPFPLSSRAIATRWYLTGAVSTVVLRSAWHQTGAKYAAGRFGPGFSICFVVESERRLEHLRCLGACPSKRNPGHYSDRLRGDNSEPMDDGEAAMDNENQRSLHADTVVMDKLRMVAIRESQ